MEKRNNLITETKARYGSEYIRKLQQPTGKYKDKDFRRRAQPREKE